MEYSDKTIDYCHIEKAISTSDFHSLKELSDSGYVVNEWTYDSAAILNSFECIKYIKENIDTDPYKWSYTTCQEVAENGNLECLKYLHENGCEWSVDTLISAAKGGHIQCLEYAFENGCYHGSHVFDGAFEGDSLESFKFLLEYYNGKETDLYSPWRWHMMIVHDAVKCFEYFHEKQCICDDIEGLYIMACNRGAVNCIRYLLKVHPPSDKIRDDMCQATVLGDEFCRKRPLTMSIHFREIRCYDIDRQLECLKFLLEEMDPQCKCTVEVLEAAKKIRADKLVEYLETRVK